ncbi:unnamed protein product [Bacillus phage SPP1]|uniref:Bacteriophage SPP1 complete nucleotide sequence n=1 Tax=Bacillus phage SPP1 TaxID=10724 RepID=O48438_BPSPP|nr:hypothetical protein SPP1p007 [Bacillus phage SPP1]CAA66578.1 unnamed protein product [Bacillus phage SPP1]
MHASQSPLIARYRLSSSCSSCTRSVVCGSSFSSHSVALCVPPIPVPFYLFHPLFPFAPSEFFYRVMKLIVLWDI